MSISNLLRPNNYNLFVNSVTTEDQFSAIPVGASQALTVGTETKVNFANATVVGPHYSGVTSTFTALVADNYQFSANVEVSIDLTADDNIGLTAQLLKNGVTVLQESHFSAPVLLAGGVRNIVASLPLQWYGPLAVNDAITVVATGTSNSLGNGNVTLLGALNPGTWFSGKRA